jgi:hypothetical protein
VLFLLAYGRVPQNWVRLARYTRYAVGVWTTKEHEMSEQRETTNTDMDQAIPRLAGDIAPGRAENSRSFSQTNSRCEFVCEKEKAYHAAAGESGHLSRQMPGLEPTAYLLSNQIS